MSSSRNGVGAIRIIAEAIVTNKCPQHILQATLPIPAPKNHMRIARKATTPLNVSIKFTR
jgi:hypothetical protein